MQDYLNFLRQENNNYAFVFDNPRSQKWEEVKALIQKNIVLEADGITIAFFGADLESMKKLYPTLLVIKHWQTAHFYHKDRELKLYEIFQVASCIAQKKNQECMEYVRHYEHGYTWFILPCKSVTVRPVADEKGFLENYKKEAQFGCYHLCPYYHPNVLCGPFDRKGKIKKPSLCERLFNFLKR